VLSIPETALGIKPGIRIGLSRVIPLSAVSGMPLEPVEKNQPNTL
jgi:hypothetical protein